MLKIIAPAKINLVLEVLGKRADGYHEIKSVVQTIDLCDELFLEKAEHISLECDKPELSGPDNLVLRGADSIKERSGYREGCRIVLRKNIPVAAGLGGGSSDAAATLKGLNNLWGLGMSRADLMSVAIPLGSDVPLFMYGGSLLMKGRGEKVTPIPQIKNLWFVVLVPDLPAMPDKTKSLYAQLDTAGFSTGSHAQSFLHGLKTNNIVNTSNLFNAFESVAFRAFSGLEHYWQAFLQAGAVDVHLAGSGPALFSLFSELSAAEDCLNKLASRKYIAFLVGVYPSVAGL